MTKHRPPIDDEVTIVYERDRPVAVTMPYAAYERLRGVDPFADRPLSRDPVDLAIARAGDKANAAEARARRGVAAREDREVTEAVPAEVARALATGVTPLKAWREGCGLTQAVLAARAGLSRAYLAQLEAGSREPSLAALRRLAAALDLLADDLIPPVGRRG
jgi:DNA-binding XRE family transcriptional regulator